MQRLLNFLIYWTHFHHMLKHFQRLMKFNDLIRVSYDSILMSTNDAPWQIKCHDLLVEALIKNHFLSCSL